MSFHRRIRGFRSIALSLLVLGLSLNAPSTFAQIAGMPGGGPGDAMQMGPDWGVGDANLQGIDLSTLKKAYRKGLKLLKKGDCRKATEQFDFVLSVLPENAGAHYLAGSADRCEKKFESAALHYSKAIEHDEAMYPAYKSLGISYLAIGDLESAAQLLSRMEVKRFDCDSSCPKEFESAYVDLKRTIQMVRARQAPLQAKTPDAGSAR